MVNNDCMEVVEVMIKGEHSIGPAVAIYEECTFSVIFFEHCPKEGDVVGIYFGL